MNSWRSWTRDAAGRSAVPYALPGSPFRGHQYDPITDPEEQQIVQQGNTYATAHCYSQILIRIPTKSTTFATDGSRDITEKGSPYIPFSKAAKVLDKCGGLWHTAECSCSTARQPICDLPTE